jgi:hypothetical protein
MPSKFVRGLSVGRAETIDDLVKTRHLTPAGADWTKLRTDPFHDFPHGIQGYPDADCFDTVTSCFNYSVSLTKPAGAAGNWDAHIFTMPFASNTVQTSTSVDGVITATADSYNLGLVNIAKADAGQILFPSTNPVVATNFSMERIDAFTAISAGLSRIIGMGIEVIDTSSVLNKQGDLAAYRIPVSHSGRATSRVIQADAKFGTQSSLCIPRPPLTLAEATAYRQTVRWEARDGCYIAVGQEGINNPFTQNTNDSVIITEDPALAGTDVVLQTGFDTSAGVAAPNMSCLIPVTAVKYFNLGQHGVFLSGLSGDSTFTVRVRVYVERAPLSSDVDLIPLATPSPAYDYKALAMYSMIVSELPSAVPVSFNAKGDWWRMIVKVIRKVAPIVGTVLTPFIGPEAMTIGNLVGQVAQAIPTESSASGQPKAAPKANVQRRTQPSQPAFLNQKANTKNNKRK